MSNYSIYQIYYDEATRLSNDSGFLQLDNSFNERPDWSEYWPIRNYFKNNILEDNKYYGFFSPKFNSKTLLLSNDVTNLVNNSHEDVISFSPYYDQSAYALNIFEQALANHEGIQEHISNIFKNINPNIDIFSIIMPASRTIFCNFFVAKRIFWLEWFHICEILFSQAEDQKSILFKSLNTLIPYGKEFYPVKVFIIERMASYLLHINCKFSIKSYDSLSLPFSNSMVSSNRERLLILNPFKEAYSNTKLHHYVSAFYNVRMSFFN